MSKRNRRQRRRNADPLAGREFVREATLPATVTRPSDDSPSYREADYKRVVDAVNRAAAGGARPSFVHDFMRSFDAVVGMIVEHVADPAGPVAALSEAWSAMADTEWRDRPAATLYSCRAVVRVIGEALATTTGGEAFRQRAIAIFEGTLDRAGNPVPSYTNAAEAYIDLILCGQYAWDAVVTNDALLELYACLDRDIRRHGVPVTEIAEIAALTSGIITEIDERRGDMVAVEALVNRARAELPVVFEGRNIERITADDKERFAVTVEAALGNVVDDARNEVAYITSAQDFLTGQNGNPIDAVYLRQIPGIRARLIDNIDAGRHDPQIRYTFPGNFHRGRTVTRSGVADGDLWYVNPDLCDLVVALAPTLPDDPLHADTIPTPRGIAFFARPISLDPDNTAGMAHITIGALSWTRTRIGDETGDPYGVVVLAWAAWHGWTPWPISGASRWTEGDPPPTVNMVAPYLAALWALARTPRVIEITDTAPDRAERRRAERTGRTLPPIRTLDLRHAVFADPDRVGEHGAPAGKRTVEWKRRWIVGWPAGFTRSQPYGPGRRLRRTIWIAPYLKGPEGLPMDIRPTVHRLRS